MPRKVDDFNAKDRIDLRLLEHHVYFLTGEIAEENVNDCIKWITYENLDNKQDKLLTLYVNSPGGDLYQAFALIDAMRNSKHTIRTVGMGLVMSAGFLIFASGTQGERYISKNTGSMCHQFTESTEGKYHDIKAALKETEMLNLKMVDILKEATGLAPSVIKRKLLPASDVYLTAAEMVDLGVADHVV